MRRSYSVGSKVTLRTGANIILERSPHRNMLILGGGAHLVHGYLSVQSANILTLQAVLIYRLTNNISIAEYSFTLLHTFNNHSVY